MTTPVEVSYTRYITFGAIVILGMLFALGAHCSARKAEVIDKCLEAGHDPAACNNLRIG